MQQCQVKVLGSPSGWKVTLLPAEVANAPKKIQDILPEVHTHCKDVLEGSALHKSIVGPKTEYEGFKIQIRTTMNSLPTFIFCSSGAVSNLMLFLLLLTTVSMIIAWLLLECAFNWVKAVVLQVQSVSV